MTGSFSRGRISCWHVSTGGSRWVLQPALYTGHADAQPAEPGQVVGRLRSRVPVVSAPGHAPTKGECRNEHSPGAMLAAASCNQSPLPSCQAAGAGASPSTPTSGRWSCGPRPPQPAPPPPPPRPWCRRRWTTARRSPAASARTGRSAAVTSCVPSFTGSPGRKLQQEICPCSGPVCTCTSHGIAWGIACLAQPAMPQTLCVVCQCGGVNKLPGSLQLDDPDPAAATSIRMALEARIAAGHWMVRSSSWC
jgi:hypothetical protein